MRRTSLFIFIILQLLLPSKAQLFINEFQASNITTILEPDGNYLEWIEIYNGGSSYIDLYGYHLTDNLDNPLHCKIADHISIGPKGHIIIWLERESNQNTCDFKLDMDGEEIGLFSPSGVLLDNVAFGEQYVDISYGRSSDGSAEWSYFGTPTPEAANTAGIQYVVFPDEVNFSINGGVYSGNQTIELSTTSTNGIIKYSVDGSWPTQASLSYQSPIGINTSTVIRARVFESDKLPGNVKTNSYILDESTSLPIVSLSTDPENFFSGYKGIYVEGYRGIPGNCTEEPVNWNRDWERPVNIEYFAPDGMQEINQLAGTKIFGGCSRYFSLKSLAIIARKKYGDNSLNYQFFNAKPISEFKSIVLRNSGNDAKYTMLRDGFMQSLLIGKMDIDYLGYQPAIIYLNGEYWGILNVREKINEHYPASNYDLDSDEIDMLEKEHYLDWGEVISGDGAHYEELINYIEEHDLSDDTHFEHVSEQMDVKEFLNYYLAQIYIQNEDWPQANIKYWRFHGEGGKWRWILFDTDIGWGLFPKTGNALDWAIRGNSWDRLIRGLLENPGFKNEFIQRMASHINTTFRPVNVTPVFDSIKGVIENEISRHETRWGMPLESYFDWQTNQVIPTFTVTRPDSMRIFMMQKFGISGLYSLSATVDDQNTGYIEACEVSLPQDFNGLYFKNIPLRIVAVPRSGYTFSHWEGASTSANETIYLNLASDNAIKAVFKTDTPVSQVYINEVCASNTTTASDEYGQYDDWIEVYNDNGFDVDLAGWFVSDSAGFNIKYQIPRGSPELTTVKSKDYLLIWCDDQTSQGVNHTNFKLKREGETISLVQKIGNDLHIVDSISYNSLFSDITFGKDPQSGQWEYMEPTPLSMNRLNVLKSIFINEFLTVNDGTYLDEYGEADDWIEIYNASSDTVDIAGLFITDSIPDPLKYQIPGGSPLSRIPPHEHIVLWADNQTDQGILHLGFKLDSREEQIGIYQVGSGMIDSLSYSYNFSGAIMGRLPDGSSNLQYVTASPGASNHVALLENLYINEYMASNGSTVVDEYGEYDDWIEIYNANDFPVDIGGIFITDSLEDPVKYRIPISQSDSTTISAKDFLVLWADGQVDQGVLHLDFKLRSSGEQIGIVQPDGMEFIDSLSYDEMISDLSVGRLADGTSNMQIVTASPGFSNYISPTERLYISEIVASGNESNPDKSGEYDDWIEIYNDNDFEVDIGGLFITDSLDHLSKFRIPNYYSDSTTIGAKGYMILWADNQPEQGINHLGFKLSGKGEELALVNLNGAEVIDSVTYPDQYRHFSYSRLDNTGSWKFLRPTHSAFNASTPVSGISINEFMASNTSVRDEYGEYDDWIELYNTNEFPVDIGGLYLTDSIGDPTKYRIPSHSPDKTTIQAKGFYILYADNTSEQGVNHTNFKLSRSGEQIILIHYDESTVLDSLTYSEQYRNSSLGRISESGSWYVIPPTPGASNVIPDFSHLMINEVMAYNKTIYGDEYNEYDDWIELYNAGDESLDIGGLYVTDSLGFPTLFRISTEHPDSTTIPAKDYIILWADNTEEQGILHLGFKISKTGETIGLFDYRGEMIDTMTYPFISPNLSWGRKTDGNTAWTRFFAPTPLMSNISTSVNENMLISNHVSVYPNPVTDRAIFEISVDKPCNVKIEIIDNKGIILSLLEAYHCGSGRQRIDWDVRDAAGSRLASGLYYCRILTGEGSWVCKIMVQ
ncbi:lamin tail domain-containing protein [bacterium]|nr:lamin tail domain-containing protein [bacterium]